MCGCDYERPTLYNVSIHNARKQHKCCECGCDISMGEEYEKTVGVWDGDFRAFKACTDCLKVRSQLEKEACYCILHGGLYEDAHNYVQEMYGEKRVSMLRIFSIHRLNKKGLA